MLSIVKLEPHTPAVGTSAFDLVSAGNLYSDFDIPVWISVAFWVVTPDVLAVADGYQIDINYVDPTGQTRTINSTPFSLGNGAAFSVIPVTPIQRESATSLVELVATRGGAGLGAPEVAARIMMTRLCNDNIAVSNIWTP